MTDGNDTPRVYVACLASYNAGILHGRWVDLDGTDAEDIADTLRLSIADVLRESPEPNVTRADAECTCGHFWTVTVPGMRPIAPPVCPECDDAEGSRWAGGPYPSAEEWAFHDFEGFGSWSPGEYESVENLAAMAAGIDEHGEAFAAFVSHFGEDPEKAANSFEDAYQGEWTSVADYAENLTRDCREIPEWLDYYIDWEAMGRDMERGGDVATEDAPGGVYIFSYNW